MRLHRNLLPAALALLLAPAVRAAAQPALEEFESRLPALRRQIPALVKSAEWAAAHNLQHTNAWVILPTTPGQKSFTAEFVSRAGGLSSAWLVDRSRMKTNEPDVVLISVRSWEEADTNFPAMVAGYKAHGWTTVVFGSASGKPAGLRADYFLDNGAPSPARSHARINVPANIALGWMWCCEYGAAMSRKGKFPGILYSVAMPNAKDHNNPLQAKEGKATVSPCGKAIPAGELAEIYLERVEKLAADCKSGPIQAQIAKAAGVVAERMKTGGRVGITGMGHVILDEVFVDTKAPWFPFRSVSGHDANPFSATMKPGEMMVYIAYAGMNSAYKDYGKLIREAGVDLITCYAPDPVWARDVPPVKAHIDQCWKLPDAEVPIPIFPHVMAPVSGINAVLVLRMLDDEVAARLPAPTPAPPAP